MISLLKAVLRLNRNYLAEHFAEAKLKASTLKKIEEILNAGNEIKLEIGAGNKSGKNGWVTLDMHKGCDIQWDLRNGIPFKDNSISHISSHLFEHLTFNESQQLLAECKRVLKPDGVFLVCVPNSRLYIEAYTKNDTEFRKNQPYFQPAWNNTTKLDFLNYVAYMDGHHKYMFDEENLLKVIEKAGLRNAALRDFNPELDLKERDFESIYAQGVK